MLLFAIPHQGLIVDDIETMQAAKGITTRSALLDQLKIGSHALQFLQEPFRELIVESGYKVVSYYETHATPRLELVSRPMHLASSSQLIMIPGHCK